MGSMLVHLSGESVHPEIGCGGEEESSRREEFESGEEESPRGRPLRLRSGQAECRRYKGKRRRGRIRRLYGHGASAAADCAPTRPGLEEAGADAVWEIGQIDEGKEVDGIEFAVDGGRAADAAGDFEVGAEEPGRAQASRDGNAGGMAGVAGLRKSAQGRMDEVPVHEGPIHGHAVVFILGGDGAAADEGAGVVAGGVDGDAFPEGVEDHDVAVVDVNAGAAEFEEFAADRFVDGEVEDLIAVVTKIVAGDFTR